MNAPAKISSAIPFDAARLDRLMDEAGMDVLIATSKHNVQYLLGGHRAFFFDYMDAMGLSRYLPVMVYAKGAPDKAAYFGHRLENFQRENNPFWTPVQQCNSSGSVDTMQKAIEHIKQVGHQDARASAPSCRSCRSMPARRCRTRSRDARSRTRCSCWSACARSRRRTNWRSSRSRRRR